MQKHRFVRPQRHRPVEEVLVPDAWHHRGEAVVTGRFPTIAWSGIVGEEALYRVVHVGKNQRLVRFVGSRRPDPHRVKPPCEHYDPCGGCPLMHMNAEGQDRARRAMLRQALASEGLGELPIDPTVTGPDLEFRHVLKLVAGYGDDERPRIGAPGRNLRHVTSVTRCRVLTPTLREVMLAIMGLCADLDLRPYEPGRGGLVRHFVARQSALTGEVLVTVVAGHSARVLTEFAESLSRSCPTVRGVHIHLNDGPTNAIFAPDGQGLVGTSTLVGISEIVEGLGDVQVRLGPGDFFQTNPAIAQRLCADLLAFSGAERDTPVVDLYSGVGAFTLAFARKTGWALGVEANEGAVRHARESARIQDIPAEFLRAEVLEALPGLVKRLADRHPVVVVDPARRGLEAGVIAALLELAPRRVLVVSCNPRALARDLAVFQARGYSVAHLRPYDMFPNTAHLEVLAVLEPPDGSVLSGRGPRRKVVR